MANNKLSLLWKENIRDPHSINNNKFKNNLHRHSKNQHDERNAEINEVIKESLDPNINYEEYASVIQIYQEYANIFH